MILQMALTEFTQIGLTFGQLISVLTLIGGMLLVWINLNIKVSNAELNIKQLEKGRIDNANNIEKIRTENREEHQKMEQKLDRIIENTSRR